MGPYSKITINKIYDGAEFLFEVHVALVSQLNVAAPWPPTFFFAATALCSAPCLCSDFRFIFHEVFVAKDSGEHLGLTLGSSGHVDRLWSWGPGLKVRHGAHSPCNGELATYGVTGTDPAHAVMKPFNVSDRCQCRLW